MVIYIWQEDGVEVEGAAQLTFSQLLFVLHPEHLMRLQMKYVSLIPLSNIFKYRNIKDEITQYWLLKHV